MDPARSPDDIPEIDYDSLITEDGQPVESVYHERQSRMLVEILYSSWEPGQPFVALADVGLFGKAENPAVAPDVMVSLGVTIPPGPGLQKKNRSYYVWRYGKAPDVVMEVVSDKGGGEEGKFKTFADLGVSYVVLWDPEKYLSNRPLRAFELHGRHYVDLVAPWLADLGLGLATWDGEYDGMTQTWLRWVDSEGRLLPYAREALAAQQRAAAAAQSQAEVAQAQAEVAQAQAEVAQAQAEAERQRAERLAERLRALGEDV